MIANHFFRTAVYVRSVLISLVMVLPIPLAHASTYYVALNGNDTYTPAQAQSKLTPWATIAHAATLLQPGDTVRVASGIYPPTYTPITARGTKEHPITFVGDSPQPRLTAQGGNTINITGSTYIVFKNFDVTNDNHEVNYTGGANGIFILGASTRITIENCTVHDCGGGGIGTGNQQGGGCDYITIKGNTVCNCGWDAVYQCSGISLWMNYNADPSDTGYHNYITSNICYGNSNKLVTKPAIHTDGNGIILDVSYSHCSVQGGKDSPDTPTYVGYNTCYDNGGRGVHTFYNDNATFDHNTCYHNCQDTTVSGAGELSVNSATGCKVVGNIAVSSGAANDQCVILWQASDAILTGNLYFGGKIDGPLVGNIVADPKFEHPTGTLPNFDVLKGGPADPKSGVLGAWATWSTAGLH